MTDKELIKQEIERRRKQLPKETEHKGLMAVYGGIAYELTELLQFIDSLSEESGCEVNFTTKSEDLEEAMELSVSEEPLLEFFATGQPTIGAYNEDSLRNQFEAGAEWQKQQMKEALQTEYEKGRFDMQQEMMKDAVEGQIYREYIGDDGISIAFGLEAYLNEHNPKHNKLHDGDKVKIIIVKEEQQ